MGKHWVLRVNNGKFLGRLTQLAKHCMASMSPKRKWIFIKFIIFAILSINFIIFYMYQQLDDFIKDRTTITTRFSQSQSIELPTITFCMSPAQKTSVATAFGFQTFDDWQTTEIPGTTIDQRIQNLSYILNQDFQLNLSEVRLKVGINEVDGSKYEVKPIFTWSEGICYKIQPKFELTENRIPWKARFEITFTDKLKKIDIPKEATVFLTSNTSWHGIVAETWPQFRPTEINLDLSNKEYLKYVLLSRTTQMIFQQGVASTEDCFWAEVLKTKCPKKCIVYFEEKPKCQTIEEWQCIKSQWSNDVWTKCLYKTRALKFRAKDSDVQSYTTGQSSKVWIEMYSMSEEIEEEVDVITLSGLIGSLGGSLGLFFGFSIFTSVIFFFESWLKIVV